MIKLDKDYWSKCYKESKSGWNTGGITTPLKEYFDQIEDKNLKILIPGVGHGHELLYLYRNGFNNVTAIDIAEEPLQHIVNEEPNFPREKLINIDFFEHKDTYDLIVEQTFFCALNPNLRFMYAKKMNELLKENGKLIGLLFDFTFSNIEPPFGGNMKEYQELFSKYMSIKKMERAYNSIKPRKGRELFIIINKKYE